MKKVALGMLAASIALTGCIEKEKAPYELAELDGEVFRLNNQTGEVAFLSKGRIMKLPTLDVSKPLNLKTSGSFYQQLQFDAKLKSSSSNVNYKLELRGYEGKKNEAGQLVSYTKDFAWFNSKARSRKLDDFIELRLEDSEGFVYKTKRIDLEDFAHHSVGYKGEVIGFVYEGDFSVDISTMANATTLHYTYSLPTAKAQAELEKEASEDELARALEEQNN